MNNIQVKCPETNTGTNPLGQDFTVRSLLRFALPTIVTMLFMGLYTIGDTIFVSRFVNTDALSAVNIVTPVVNLIVGLGTMLAAGGSAIAARRMGAGETETASQDFTLIIFCGAALGILISLAGTVSWTASYGNWARAARFIHTAGNICSSFCSSRPQACSRYCSRT